jgi:hypothetical protein
MLPKIHLMLIIMTCMYECYREINKVVWGMRGVNTLVIIWVHPQKLSHKNPRGSKALPKTIFNYFHFYAK